MSHHVFCDGLQDVSIVSGVVRLDYVHHVPGAPGPDGKPLPGPKGGAHSNH